MSLKIGTIVCVICYFGEIIEGKKKVLLIDYDAAHDDVSII